MTNNIRTAGFVKSHSQSGQCPVITQVLPALVRGGVERGTIEMARAIIDAGGKAVVISSGGPLVRHLDRIDAVHHTLPVGVKNPLAWPSLRRRVKRILKEEGADVVHVRSRVPAQIVLPAAKSLGIISVSTVHGRFQNTSLLKRIFNGKMLSADQIIAISRYVKSQIERQFGEQGSKLTVIQRGVDTEVFDPAAVAQSRIIRFVDSIALPEDQPVIMLPARPTAWKGHEILLEALAKIADRPFICVLLGAADGKQAFMDRLTQTGMRLGLEGRFRLAHGVDDMPAALMAACEGPLQRAIEAANAALRQENAALKGETRALRRCLEKTGAWPQQATKVQAKAQPWARVAGAHPLCDGGTFLTRLTKAIAAK